jgi:predicted anti-sigma-YlaC factor YlaD
MDHENCRALLSSLSDFVDGILEDELCDVIERHMGECENCRIVVDTLRKTISLYQDTAGTVQMPDHVRERLYHRLDLSEYLDV